MMPAALSKRTDRVRLYSYSDAGSDGVVSSKYTFVEEVWAQFLLKLDTTAEYRLTPDRAMERTSGQAATHERYATFGFHEQVSINNDMVLTINGEAYKVVGIPDPRTYVPGMLRLVIAVWVDRAELTLAEN